VGNYLTTPIMGNNASADRTIWSSISYQDSVQMLTNTLGARPDDINNLYAYAVNVIMSYLRVDSRFGTASKYSVCTATSARLAMRSIVVVA